MLLESLSKNGKPVGKCFAKKCEDCNFYRRWTMVVDPVARTEEVQQKCSWELMFRNLPALIGAIDGVQGAVNEIRNDGITIMRGMAKHGVDAPLKMWMKHRNVTTIRGESQELLDNKKEDGG